MQTSPRRLVVLAALAGVLGCAGGGAAFLLLRLIALLTNLALFHRVGWQLPSLANLHPNWTLFAAAIGGATLVSLLALWSPVIRGHGIPEAMEAILEKQSRISPRAAIAKPLSAAIAIGTGGPFGAEGPIIVTGGALGSLLGQVLHVSPSERKILLASGAAAGMAATFGSPLAAVVLAIELLLFEFSTRAFVPLVVASSVAAGMHSAIFGAGPLFAVPQHSYAGLGKLPFFVVAGLCCGILAVIVTKGLFAIEAGFRKLPIREFWHPMIGAVGFAVVGFFVPRALGVGYDSIGNILGGRFTVGVLASLAMAKLVAWWIALASGTSGGTLAPILMIGGAFGGLMGVAGQHLFPSLHLSPGAVAIVAMAATFGAATRATFASIVFVFEITRDYQVILPLMLASVMADIVATVFLKESLMTEKLARRGLNVRAEYQVDVLASTLVRQVMTSPVRTLRDEASIADARIAMSEGGFGALPIVDRAGTCRAIVTRGDVLGQDLDEALNVMEIASSDVVSVGPEEPVLNAARLMVEESVEHIPVIHEGVLAGICTRTDILRARKRQFEHEERQPGWRPPGSFLSRRTSRSVSS